MSVKAAILLALTASLAGHVASVADHDVLNPLFSPSHCAVKTYPPIPAAAPNVTWYVVNLDLPAQQRWGHVVKDFVEPLKGLGAYLDEILGEQIKHHLGFLVPVKFFYWLLGRALPPTMYKELKGMANVTTKHGIPFNTLVGLNVFYELTAACTSVVVRGKDGRLIHGRNLDFGGGLGMDPDTHQFIVSEFLRALTVNVEFRRKGRILYRATTYAGYLTILNGVKRGQFTMSWNQRVPEEEVRSIKSIFSWVLGLKNGTLMGHATRRVFEEAESYEEARAYLENVQLLSPVYFILGGVGPDEGVVLTRSLDRSLAPMTLSRNASHLLQTNYDHWTTPPNWDDRRTPGEVCVNFERGASNFSALFDVLSTKPVLNLQTTFTALMNVTSGRLEAYVRKCPFPCDPPHWNHEWVR